MRKKLFTLMTLLLTAVTGAWADADFTYALSSFTESPTGTYTYEFSENVLKNKTAWVEVPSATVEGTIAFKGSSNKSDRYLYIYKTNGTVKDDTRKVAMTATSWESVTIAYTPSDILTDGGKYYLVFGTSDDFKIKGIKYTAVSTIAGAPVFSPASGQSVAAGSKIEITSASATSIKYKWTDSAVTPSDGWSTYDAEDKVTVPAFGSSTTYLHAQGFKGEDGGTPGYAQYTITAPDTEAPVFDSATPANGATNVAVDAALTVTYNENIVIDDSKITLVKTSDDSEVEFTASASGAVLTVTPNAALAYNTGYTLTIGAGAVADGSDNATAAATVIAFTTKEEVVADPVITTYGHAFQITCATDGATIHYTTDGSTPDTSSDEFTLTDNNLMTLPASGTVKAYAVKTGATASAVVSQAITVPAVGSTTGSLLMTLQPETTGSDVTYASGFSKGGFTMTNDASDKGIQLTDLMAHYDYAFKCAGGTFTITPPADVTIQSVKIFAMKNTNKSTGNITAETSEGYSPATSLVLPRYTYYANGDGVFSEIVITNTTLAEGAVFKFKTDAQFRLYVEVYGTTSATSVDIAPAKEYTTYVPSYNLDFTDHAKLTAYIATAADAGNVTITKVNKVPAGTPIVLKTTDTENAISVPVATSTDDVSANKLKCSDGVNAIGGDGKWDYILSNGMFYHASNGVLPAGKAYLHLDAAPTAPELNIVIDGENGDDITTGISAIEHSTLDIEHSEVYNLNGQRVSQPTKGLYIVNGKKVVVK